MEAKLKELMRDYRSIGVIMLDIDHFKQFNDTFGHPAGDLLIAELGKFLQKNIRDKDIACRYGGEEFILLLPNAPLEILQKRAEFLREGAEQLEIHDHMGSSHNGLTISLGVAIYPNHGQSIEDVIRAADSALYHAKQGGRNLTVIAL
jgi:diguanylate cyclase (GGDEF)-like protein